MSPRGSARTVPSIHPVILSGGSGSRLWPLSREALPKQFLALTGGRSLLEETARRLGGADFARPVVICNGDQHSMVAEHLARAGVEPGAIVLEPCARNTGPAAALAALLAAEAEPGALLLILPSDHVIADKDAFLTAVATAAPAAEAGSLVAFGITPKHAETGYGYIRRSGPLDGFQGCYRIDRYVEKPDPETAAGYLEDGGYDWNSGIFLFSAAAYMGELDTFRPDMAAACRRALTAAYQGEGVVRPGAEDFSACANEAIDTAVMENTAKGAVVPVDMGWSDIGAWSALWDLGGKDADGNVLTGDVVTHQVGGSLIRSEGPRVAAVGLDDIIIVAMDDAVLAVSRDRADELRQLAGKLEGGGGRARVHRPWGWYRVLEAGDGFQVKHIFVAPGGKLSLQRHQKRSEHWVVTAGTATVTVADDTFRLQEGASAFIPAGTKHRLENYGETAVHLIEVQNGTYLGEDDIERFDDAYGRA